MPLSAWIGLAALVIVGAIVAIVLRRNCQGDPPPAGPDDPVPTDVQMPTSTSMQPAARPAPKKKASVKKAPAKKTVRKKTARRR
jgi:hypothetical protein